MNVTIENGTGTGLSLVNIKGAVMIENCIFRHNLYYVDRMYRAGNTIYNDFTQRGGGMQIILGSQIIKNTTIVHIAFKGASFCTIMLPVGRSICYDFSCK